MPNHSPRTEVQQIGVALLQAEQDQNISQQIALYQQLLEITPDLALGHAKLAILLLEKGDNDTASRHIEIALSHPQDDQIDKMLFEPMAANKHFIGDLACARKWYAQSPNYWRFTLLGEALMKAKLYEEAESSYSSRLEKPLPPSQQGYVLSKLGTLYYNVGRFHESIACNRLALELYPNDFRLHFKLATSLESAGRYEEAFAHYVKVLEQEPENIGTQNNLALLMLRLGQFREGWEHYEWRWAQVLKEHDQHFNIPRWQGEPLEGKRLLVWAEQGIGDHILFGSMLPDLVKLGGQIHYEIYERLDPLFERSFPTVKFFRRNSEGPTQDGDQELFRQSWPASDLHIPMGSLGQFLRRSRKSFPGTRSYLKADAGQVTSKRQEYQQRFPGKHLIGLSWRGGIDTSNDMQSRRIPLSELARLATLGNVQFINLQYGDTEQERAEALALGLNIHHDASVDPLKDMDAQASQLCALDAVLSVDNTTIHLAGALGVPTYALLQLNPNWRWGLNEGPSYWFPSIHLVRNRELGHWENALDRVVTCMRADGII